MGILSKLNLGLKMNEIKMAEQAIKDHGSQRKAAASLGWTRSKLRRRLLSNDDVLRGKIPEIGLNQNIPAPLQLSGVSYLVKADSENPVMHWVKANVKTQDKYKAFYEFIESMSERIKPIDVVALPSPIYTEYLTQYTITDLHCGMYSWNEETLSDWDLDICEKTILTGIQTLADMSPNSGTGLLVQLGDFFHYDSHETVTPTNKHLLDADTRFAKMFECGVDIMVKSIEILLNRHDKVKVIVAQGNHDLSLSDALRLLVKRLYANNPRVEIIGDSYPFYCLLHGDVMIGCHHGHLRKKVNLASHFSIVYSDKWGKAKKRYIHCGHLHQLSIDDKNGCVTWQHPTIAAPDAYAAHKFDQTNRELTAIHYDKQYGIIATNTISIKQIENYMKEY